MYKKTTKQNKKQRQAVPGGSVCGHTVDLREEHVPWTPLLSLRHAGKLKGDAWRSPLGEKRKARSSPRTWFHFLKAEPTARQWVCCTGSHPRTHTDSGPRGHADGSGQPRAGDRNASGAGTGWEGCAGMGRATHQRPLSTGATRQG